MKDYYLSSSATAPILRGAPPGGESKETFLTMSRQFAASTR
jgi:hypothetical protein